MIGDSNGYLNGVLRHWNEGPRPAGDTLELPDPIPGHDLTVWQVKGNDELNVWVQGWQGICQCGEQFTTSSRLIHDDPPPRTYVLWEWAEHLLDLRKADR